ncbi:hypothetical protein ACQJBY_030324 [Aegilops geniculata]
MDPKTLAAKEEEELVEQLCSELTCACAHPHPPPTDGAAAVGPINPPDPAPAVVNLSPTGFLATLRQAAVDASSVVGEFTRARLLSFSRAFARGWGPAGPGRYERRSVHELVDDRIFPDLNLPAEDDPEEQMRRRKRNVSSSNLDGAIPGPSKRKRSLSPPNITDLEEELAGSQVAAAEAEDAALKQAAKLGEEQADGGSASVFNAQDQPAATENDEAEADVAAPIEAAMPGEAAGRPRLSQADIRERLGELISKVKNQATRTFPENYLGKLNWFRKKVAKDHGYAMETSAHVGSALSDQPASRSNVESTAGERELPSQLNVASAQAEERRPEIGTLTIAGGLSPVHGDGGMSSQREAGNEDKASDDVHEGNASLQVSVPDVIPRVPQPSPAMEDQPDIASPRREPDNLDGGQNDLDEMQPGPSSCASAPP